MDIKKRRPLGKWWNETDFMQAQKMYSFGFKETSMIIYWELDVNSKSNNFPFLYKRPINLFYTL